MGEVEILLNSGEHNGTNLAVEDSMRSQRQPLELPDSRLGGII